MSTSQAQITSCESESYVQLTLDSYSVRLPFTKGSRLLIGIIGLYLRDKQGKPVFSYSQIAHGLGYSARTWSYQLKQKVESTNFDLKYVFWGYKSIHRIEPEILRVITQIVCQYPLASHDYWQQILKRDYNIQLVYSSFRVYVEAMDTFELLRSLSKQFQKQELYLNLKYFLHLLLDNHCTTTTRQYIQTHAIKTSNKVIQLHDFQDVISPVLAYLYVNGCSLKALSLLFGMAKSTISGRIHKFAGQLEHFLPRAITDFSGKICVDEKWVKIQGHWQYVLSAVDAESGIPLFCKRMPQLTKEAWTVFFTLFEQHYGRPKMVVSDGDAKIAAALKLKWGQVVHQLCWFHKMKNLSKKLFIHIPELKVHRRAHRLMKGAFHNQSVSARKKSLRTLLTFTPLPIQNYVNQRMLAFWRKLSKAYTNNAAERYNRKIEKAMKGRYGLKNEACAEVLINLTWWNDYLNHHQNSQVNLANIFQFDIVNTLNGVFGKHQFIHFNVKELRKTKELQRA